MFTLTPFKIYHAVHITLYAETIEFLKAPPGNHLEKLSGRRRNMWSIRINQQWRLCFRFDQSRAYDVKIVDYH